MQVRDRPRVQSGVLVYDGDCGFCTRFARWAGSATPWQDLDLESAGTTEATMTTTAGWLVDGRLTETGSAAIAAALVQRGGWPAVGGRIIRAPVVRRLAELVYGIVAGNRHRMPGGTPACALPGAPAGPPRAVMVAAIVLIALAGLASLSYAHTHQEAYPSLLMPGFGYVPDDGHQMHASQVTYSARMPDGRIVAVAPDHLIPAAGPASYVMAQRTLASSAAETSEVRRWVAEQLDRWPETRGAAALSVTRHALTYSADHTLVADSVSSRTVLNLGGAR